MSRNGNTLRVLLSGPAADDVAATLANEPAISVIRDAAVDHGASRESADVLLHVLDSSGQDVADSVRRAQESSSTPLILAAYGEPNGIVETGLAIGAADVVVLPQPTETLLFAIRKAAMSAAEVRSGKVVTVFSPKGGSGKTVLSTNLAVAASRAGVDTLLVDLDLQFGDSALTLAVPPRATVADLAASAGTVDVDKLAAFVSKDSRTGVSLLAAPRRPEEADVVGPNELTAVLESARSAYAAVVIDTGPLFDAAMLAALDHTDQLLLICNPEVTSLKNVRIGLETIDRLGFDRERISVVANRMGATGAVSREEIEHALGAEIAFELPDDSAVPASINRALPVVVAEKSTAFGRAVIDVAAAVFEDCPHDEKEGRQRRSLLRRKR